MGVGQCLGGHVGQSRTDGLLGHIKWDGCPGGCVELGVVLTKVRLHGIHFLARIVHANGPEQVVCPINEWLSSKLASEYSSLVLWLKESRILVQECGAGDAAPNKAYKDLVPDPLVYLLDLKYVTSVQLLLV